MSLEVKDHICELTQDALRQKSVSHYCKVHVRRTTEAFLYLWKPMDNTGFRIDFCPFCGTSATDIIDKAFPKYLNIYVEFDVIDAPLPDRSCFQCGGTEFRALAKHECSLMGYKQLELCLNCHHLFLCNERT